MEGVNILSQTEIMTSSGGDFVMFIIGVLLCIIGIVMLFTYDEIGYTALLIIGALFVVLSFTDVCYTRPSGRYEYKATIDDDVSFCELYERYDVIGQDGKIWILEDKKE